MTHIPDNKEINSTIVKFWNEFKLLPGSEYIASSSALKAIYGLAIVSPPHKILEFGTGIGTISAFLLSVTSARIVAVDKNPEYLEIARNNIKNILQSEPSKHTFIAFQEEFSLGDDLDFDWVIIDGSVNKTEWRLISSLKNLDLLIIENQRFISRFRTLNFLLRKGLRFQYFEIDTVDETGVAVFKINQRGRRNPFLIIIDYLSTAILLLPRFIKGIFDTRGKNLFINRT
jgi:precorrin-6B methylase 2